jgi:DNA-directed RNA polymerase specialized sigma24 family protein
LVSARPETTAVVALFTELRPLVFSIGYRMLGSVAEAEDVVQETMLRVHRELRAGTEPESPKAYVTAIATRLAIDQLRSARRRRETYVGPWLPEPLLTDTARFEPSATARDALAERFFAAAQEGELAGLEALLAADATLTGDGGGQAHAFPAPLHGRARVAHAIRAIFRQGARLGARAEPAHVNGQPGLVARDASGAVVSVLTLEIAGGEVVAIRSVVNPDKLGHLGPVSGIARRRRPRA